jgi:hypothetical protein
MGRPPGRSTLNGSISHQNQRWCGYPAECRRSGRVWRFVDRGGVYGALLIVKGISVDGGFLGKPWCLGVETGGGSSGVDF